ncbi:unnamed protein product [Auanema sp. JU1783]|nr:unnamed protein product [Auanema sp. JU1783]
MSGVKFPILDSRFERPLNGSLLVQRAESARVPHVLVSQPSLDLRRTRSESQLDAKSGSEVSPNVSQDNNLEPVMKRKIISDQMRVPVEEPTTPLISEQDMTLKDVPGLPTAGSTVSLLSTTSCRTDNTDGDGEDDDSRLSRNRPSSTRQRIHATFQAGKRKVLDFIPQKKKVGGDPVEVGSEVNEGDLLDPTERESHSRSPAPSSGKRSPTEISITDKKDKKKQKKKISSRAGSSKSALDESPTNSVGTIHSRTTKAVHFEQDVLWGQSLHFDLDGALASRSGGNKYLNVTIHAKQNMSPSEGDFNEPKKPILLGYTSLYIPQLIDDCRLTLSNCHREVFFLKPPTGISSITELNGVNSTEFARHAGFDPRLCYGDITLGFRYFPNGLPSDANLNAGDQGNCENDVDVEDSVRSNSPPLIGVASQHLWKPWSVKTAGTTCAMCRGKIWLKSANCCQRCLVICHIKCVEKANTGIICTPSSLVDNDNGFDDLDLDNSSCNNMDDECTETIISSTSQTTPPTVSVNETTDSVSRRARLKSKVSEKFSYWRRGRKKDDSEIETLSRNSQSTADSVIAPSDSTISSPVRNIQDCIPDVLNRLDGSPFVHGLSFQPGNAYNEEIIANAKRLGKEIFADLSAKQRLLKVNQQIDVIRSAIEETKNGRSEAMKKEGSTDSFEGLDERLQALAVLMLHYCSALQDCANNDRETPDLPQDDLSLNVFDDSPINIKRPTSLPQKSADSDVLYMSVSSIPSPTGPLSDDLIRSTDHSTPEVLISEASDIGESEKD